MVIVKIQKRLVKKWYYGKAEYKDPVYSFTIPKEFHDILEPFLDEELEATGSGAQWRHELRIRKPVSNASHMSSEPTRGLVTGGRFAEAELMDMAHPEDHMVLLIEAPHWQDGYGNDITIQTLYAYGHALGRTLNRFLR